MRHHIDAVRQGYDFEADAVVIGSGAGGPVAAANLARAGMRVAVVEAGPEMRPADMSRDAPMVMARYYWEGGLRTIGGTGEFPLMQGRCVGGSTVVNSAIMLRLPQWVREEWRADSGLGLFTDPALDAAFDRVMARSGVAPTPDAVFGPRNRSVLAALRAAGLKAGGLPRSVVGCDGCADCLTGCHTGRKQSTDRTYLLDAERDGAQVFTCSVAEKVLVEGGRAVGVRGSVVDPTTWRRSARFTVRAPLVVLAAGAVNTPGLLLRSGIRGGGQVGATYFAHLSGGVLGVMEEPTEPWVGATQGVGAIVDEIPGLKLESLWAPLAALMVRWGDVGRPYLEMLPDVRYTAIIAAVYRGRCRGNVRLRLDGTPRARLWVADEEAHTLYRGMKLAADGLLKAGARYVYSGIRGTSPEMRTPKDTEELLSKSLRARDMNMTANHSFGTCRMGADPARSAVDGEGRVRGVEGVTIADACIFPSPSAVNPQATIMALADILSRRWGELAA